MRAKQLYYFPKLQTVLSNEYRREIESLISKWAKKTEIPACLNIYSSFVDICIRKSGAAQYSAFDIRNNEGSLNAHISALIGFIHSELETSANALYRYTLFFKNAFREFASRYNIPLQNIKISEIKLTNDMEDSIALYQSMNTDASLIEYYSGWECEDKEGNSQSLHLATWHDTYGAELTTQVHIVISNYAKKHKRTTLPNLLSMLVNLLNEFTEHCKTKKELEHSLKAEKSSAFMERILNSMLFKSMINSNDPKSFIKTWKSTVKYFKNCFIDTGFFEEPLKPFLEPAFREPNTSVHTISIGGDLNEKEKERWLLDIPLEIKDEATLDVIHQRLNRDLEHICTVSRKMFKDIKHRQKRNMKYRKTGTVKYLKGDTRKRNNVPIGINNLDNTIASFYFHGFDLGEKAISFLGFTNQTDILRQELNLPSPQTLNVFASLLILEHPKITPAWLQEWELFDKKGKKIGLKQTGNQWIAVSFKNRKGSTTAQQEVILTENSKLIVEELIKHTRFAREALKKKGNSDYRYVMLTASMQKANRPKVIGKQLSKQGKYHQALVTDSYDDNKQLILSRSETKKLAEIITPRNIRKARGLQIYLETKSLKAVSEALGHNELRINLMESYLPKPLMDYFNKRWIRQFQNAIIFEALKDSPCLFDALDFDESALNEFLNNHRLGDLPENLERASSSACNEENQEHINNLDELVFMLSTPLFQVLLAIQNVIDNAKQEDEFKPIIKKWYQSAVFILSHFALKQKSERYRRPPEEAIPLYESALNNPLDLVRFKENILCISN